MLFILSKSQIFHTHFIDLFFELSVFLQSKYIKLNKKMAHFTTHLIEIISNTFHLRNHLGKTPSKQT